MNRRYAYIFLAFLAATLFFLAVGLNGWGCFGHAFFSSCIAVKKPFITGIILALAGGAATIGGILLIAVMATDSFGTFVAAPCLLIIATALSIGAVVYYNFGTIKFSPILATCGMSTMATISVVLIVDYIAETF